MRSVTMLVATMVALGSGVALANKPVVKHEYEGVLNLNTATAQQLDQLPGVGAKAAKRIIEHRTKTPFTKADELTRVKGFGKKKFEKLKPYLAVAGPTTLKVKKGSTPGGGEAQGRSAPIKR